VTPQLASGVLGLAWVPTSMRNPVRIDIFLAVDDREHVPGASGVTSAREGPHAGTRSLGSARLPQNAPRRREIQLTPGEFGLTITEHGDRTLNRARQIAATLEHQRPPLAGRQATRQRSSRPPSNSCLTKPSTPRAVSPRMGPDAPPPKEPAMIRLEPTAPIPVDPSLRTGWHWRSRVGSRRRLPAVARPRGWGQLFATGMGGGWQRGAQRERLLSSV
jgi:hypothetical protein